MNRGTTGAIVLRQPFGGMARSANPTDMLTLHQTIVNKNRCMMSSYKSAGCPYRKQGRYYCRCSPTDAIILSYALFHRDTVASGPVTLM